MHPPSLDPSHTIDTSTIPHRSKSLVNLLPLLSEAVSNLYLIFSYSREVLLRFPKPTSVPLNGNCFYLFRPLFVQPQPPLVSSLPRYNNLDDNLQVHLRRSSDILTPQLPSRVLSNLVYSRSQVIRLP